jgi:transcription-repair coupling factor (superfamily II helicase)
MPRGLKASPHRATHGHAVVTAARSPAQRLAIPHEGHLPLAVARWADPLRRAVFIAVDDAMLQTLAAVLPAFLPDRPVLELPAWDSPPYDRSRPSRAVTGRRVATLAWLAEHHEQRVLVLTTPESLTQRIPPADRLLERSVRLGPGQSLDDGWLEATLAAFGYEQADRVTEPGEFAVHLSTADVFPAGGQVPIRIEFTENKAIASIRQFDPDDQLSFADAGPVLLLPASEGFTSLVRT